MATSADLLARFYQQNAGTVQPTYNTGGLVGYQQIPGGSSAPAATPTYTPQVQQQQAPTTTTQPAPSSGGASGSDLYSYLISLGYDPATAASAAGGGAATTTNGGVPTGTNIPMVTGSSIVDQAAEIADKAAKNQISLSELAGLLQPGQIGASGTDYVPTLAYRNAQEASRVNTQNSNLNRSSILASIQDAQNAARLTSSGQAIDIGQVNANQRIAQEQLVQGILGMLTSLRGPSNAFAYNALLNNVGTPTGETVDPFATARTVYQPLDASSILPQLDLNAIDLPGILGGSQFYNAPSFDPNSVSSGAAGGAGAGAVQPASTPAAPNTRAVTPPPTQQPAAPQQQQQASPPAAAATTVEPTSGKTYQVSQQDADYANQVMAQATPEQKVSPTTGKVMTAQDLASYTAVVNQTPSAAAGWLKANGYLGAADGAEVNMGKRAASKRGQKAADKRKAQPAARLSKTNTQPRQATPQGDDATVLAGETGQPELVVGRDFEVLDPEETQRWLSSGGWRNIDAMAATGYDTGSPSTAPIYSDQQLGSAVSYDRYTPDQISRLPIVGALSGQRQQPSFGQTGLDFSLPGSGANVGIPSYTTLSNLLPSEFDLAGSLYETPRELGGLGVDFRDIISLAQRRTPIGSGFPMLTQLAA